VPLFMGITGVNEHIELVFNAVLSNAVVMLRSHVFIFILVGQSFRYLLIYRLADLACLLITDS